MNLAYSHALEEYIAASDIDNDECARLSVVCTTCGEAVYKRVIRGVPCFCHFKKSCRTKASNLSDQKIDRYVNFLLKQHEIHNLDNIRLSLDSYRPTIDIDLHLSYITNKKSQLIFVNELHTSLINGSDDTWALLVSLGILRFREMLLLIDRKLTDAELEKIAIIESLSTSAVSLNGVSDDIQLMILLFLSGIDKNKMSVPKAGFIYIIRNPEHRENIYKVGVTTRDINDRLKELSMTSSITDFELIDHWWVKDCYSFENKIHKELRAYRIREDREFFDLNINLLKQVILKYGGAV